MILEKRKPGRKAKFRPISDNGEPVRAMGYARKFPFQYANYWNKKKDEPQVEVVFDEKNNPWFRKKST